MSTRPRADEAAPYYHTYIDQVPDGDIREILARQGEEMRVWLGGIDAERSLTTYAEGKWTIREVLGHMSDAERLFQARAFWFARGFDSPLPSFDQQTAVASAQANARAWAALVEEFTSVRAATRTFFTGLPDDAWDRRGIASDCPFSVRALAYLAAGHVAHHARLLRERYGLSESAPRSGQRA